MSNSFEMCYLRASSPDFDEFWVMFILFTWNVIGPPYAAKGDDAGSSSLESSLCYEVGKVVYVTRALVY